MESHSIRLNLFEKYLKYVPALTILFYAYLYLIGYLYLVSYFEKWGLSSLEIGFSIVDYATVALYPILTIFSLSAITMPLGYFLLSILYSLKIPSKTGKLIKTLKIIIFLSRYVAFPTGILVSAILNFLKYRQFFDWKNLLYLFAIHFFFLGQAIRHYLKNKSVQTKNLIYIMLILSIIILPIFTTFIGKSNAEIYRAYSYNPLKFPRNITGVIVYASNPLKGLEIFQTGENQYENLMLLTYKNDVYYFVANIRKLNIFNEPIEQKIKEIEEVTTEIKKLALEVDLRMSKIKSDRTESLIKEINKEIEEIKKIDLPQTDVEQRFKKIKSDLDLSKSLLNEDKIQLSNIMEKIILFNQKKAIAMIGLKSLKESYGKLSGIYDTAFAVRKEQIEQLVYLRDKTKKLR